MKIIISTLCCLVFLIHCTVSAQDFNNYTRLQSSGTVPADFTTLATQKYEQSKQQISSKSTHHEKKVQDQFYLESSFDIDNMLLSGNVLFNDPVSVYLNQIKDLLLKDDPLLRDSIRVYLLRSTEVNAFTTNNGIIMVTAGMVAQAENEAQLAYVLSHEIQHFRHKDILQESIENDRINRGKDVYKNLSNNDADLRKFQYSREIESRADLDGLDLYKKSNYSLDEAKNLFNVLEYADLPFDDVPFNKSYFEQGKYVFPDNYFLKATAAIPDNENYDDSKSTHPNIKKRKGDVIDKLGDYENTGRQKYIIKTENEFDLLQKTCRYETCLIQLANSEYEEAFYSSYLLLQADSTSKFLQKVMAKALYGIAEYKTNHCFSLISTDSKDIYGSSQQLYYFFDKIKAHEMVILALHYNLELQKKYPGDSELVRMGDDMFDNLVENFEDKVTDYLTSGQVKTAQATVVTDTVQTSAGNHPQSKYDKIKKMQATSLVSGSTEYYKYAFVDLLDDSITKNTFDNEFKKYEKDKDDLVKNGFDQMKQNRLIEKKGYALGLSKINIVDPFYVKFDQTKKSPLRYIASEEAQTHLKDIFAQNAQLLGIDINVLSSKALTSGDVQEMNDLSILNEWINERLKHENDGVNMQVSNSVELKEIASHYGSDKFCYPGVVAVREQKHVALVLIATIIYFPTLPYGIYYAVHPKEVTGVYSIVIDASTGKLLMEYDHTMNMRDSQGVLNSNIYYLLQQIKAVR